MGRILIYEGHDVPKVSPELDPKVIDQPEYTPTGRPTQNGLFFHAAQNYKTGKSKAELSGYTKRSVQTSGHIMAYTNSLMLGKRMLVAEKYLSLNSRLPMKGSNRLFRMI